MELAAYRAGEVVYQSANSVVRRATRLADKSPVFIKTLPGDAPSPDKLIRLRREFAVTRGFDDERIIKVLELVPVANGLAMVVEDFGGRSLDRAQRPAALIDQLAVAIGAASALEAVHARRVIHKDVNPANLVWSPRTGRVKLIDFGISTELSREAPSLLSPEVLEGTLSFMSPEQTGRMNRALDYRSDLYSLGATLYWLFTGSPPFDAADPMEMVHRHIATRPQPPSERAPGLPTALSTLVLKLLAKTAEDRYQSVTAVLRDLQRCREALAERGRIPDFDLADRDLSERFVIPQRLYGRDAELAELMAAYARVAEGGKALLLVAGYSGIGKSALVHEVHKPIVARRGLFGWGKFDQFNREVPYACLIQAFQGILRLLLSGSEDALAAWRKKLSTALGSNGRVITEVIPSLTLVIGEQPPVPELPPTEAQNRFDAVFAELLKTFAAAEHPLTLFLDDLQWADGPSLRLVRRFMSDEQTRHILVIGAYRDNEVEAAHPLQLTLDELRKDGAPLTAISLGPLSGDDVAALLADALQRRRYEIGELAGLCLEKTRGNPFFLTRLLQAVYEDGGFRIDRQAGRWSWSLDHIKAMDITDNVVDLMVRKIRKLPEPTRAALQLAACIGAGFDLQTLAIVSERAAIEAAEDLWPALEEGLVLPRGGEYKFLREGGQGSLGSPERVRFRWLHDRVQQAAYALIAEDQKAAVHHRLGRLLLENIDDPEDELFVIVGHLNRGASQLNDQSERDALAELNLRAGRKAILACAFPAARLFLDRGLALVGDRGWERCYPLTLQLHTEAAHATHLIPDYEATRRHYETVLARGTAVLDKVRAYEIWILACQAQALMHEGVETALAILAALGVTFPEKPGPEDLGAYLQRVEQALGGRAIDELGGDEPCRRAEDAAAIRILANIASTAYIGAPALFPLLILEGVARSLTVGDIGASGFIYATYGILLCGVLEDFERGLAFGELGRRVLDRFVAREYAAKVSYVYTSFILFWTVHLKESWASHDETHRFGLENGDHEFAAWPIMTRIQHALFLGLPLGEQIEEARKAVATCDRLNQATSGSYAQANLQAMLGLTGRSEDPCILIGEAYDETLAAPRYAEASEAFGLCNLYVTKALLFALFERWDEALEQERLCAPWASAIVSLAHVPVFRFYLSLARLEKARELEGEDRAALVAEAEEGLAKFAAWSEYNPANFRAKHRLLSGLRRALDGDRPAARDDFEAGIAAAAEFDYLIDEALGQELLGRHLLRCEEREEGRAALKRARGLYLRWGARAKADHLQERHGLEAGPAAPSQSPSGLTTATTNLRLADLDLGTVLKANLAMSSEVQREGLLRTVLTIILENAGATIAALVRPGPEGPLIEAISRTGAEVELFEHRGLDDCPELPTGLVRRVMRSREAEVLDTLPAGEGGGLRSAMALPVERQGELLACLVLGNKLSAGAFTADRVQLMRMLLTQVAVSLENARLYGRLETLVDQRTAELQRALAQLKEQQERIITQEKLASLGALTAGIAHELKNPLNFVINFSELSRELIQDIEEALGPKVGEDAMVAEDFDTLRLNIGKIQEHGRRADQIIRGMLDHSRGEHGEHQAINLNRAVERCLGLVRDSAGPGPEVEVRYELTAELGPIEARPQSLDQALRNVLENAWYAARKSAADPLVTLKTLDLGEEVAVVVRDNGPGISAEARSRLFHPFFTTKPGGEGTGLGLSITHDIIVKLHGGRVEVASEPGSFAEFTLTLPRRAGGIGGGRT